jgi:glycosyltransferase involved in cell wall biosynthesis
MTVSRHPRVLLIEGALREHGGLRLTHEMALRLRRADVPVRLMVLETVAPEGPMFSPDPSLDIVYGSGRVRRFRNSAARIALEVTRQARKSDVVVSGSEVGWGMFLGWAAARLTRRPFVVLVQSPLEHAIDAWSPGRLRGSLRWVHRHVDLAVCVSPGLVDGVVANGLAANQVTFFLPGIDIEEASKRARRTPRQPHGPGPVHLIAIGRLAAQKGFDILLRAVALAHARGAHAKVSILGDGPDRDRLERLAESLGVADAIRFEGFVADPYPHFARADAFVLSSRFEGNGSGALLEALAHGLPVIATDCVTGPRFVLRDGEIGRLVPPEDPDALAEAIRSFADDPADLQERARLGPARAADFDHGSASRELLRIIDDVWRHQRGFASSSPEATKPNNGANDRSQE